MYPYIKDKSTWPFAHDVEHFDDFPVRNPALLFSGLAYDQQSYIALWKTLNPDPVVPEVIRNFPIRQPLLWMPRSGQRNSVSALISARRCISEPARRKPPTP